MKVFKNLFGNGSKIHASEVVAKNAAGDVVGMDDYLKKDIAQTTTLASNSTGWYSIRGFQIFYIGGDAVSRGYPDNYGILIHISYDNLFYQFYVGSGGLWSRRINSDNPPPGAWTKI